jgi:hypothetical protein
MANQSGSNVNAIPVGSLYGLPGVSQFFDQYDQITDVVTTLQANAMTPWQPGTYLQQTDVVMWWETEMSINTGITYSAGTVVTSPGAPANLIQNPQLKMQGQYAPVNCQSGEDMLFFQLYRPMRGRGQRNGQDMNGSEPAPWGFNPLAAETNYTAAQWPQTNTSPIAVANYPLTLEWPGGVYLDEYWNLAPDGTILPNASGKVAPMRAFVSPQYMAGGDRVVVPKFSFSPTLAANLDQGPLVPSSAVTASANTGSVMTNVRRVGVYATQNPAAMPPVFNWQYSRLSQQYPVGAVTQVNLPVNIEYGQVLSCWARIFDPGASTPEGAYMAASNITACNLLYGTNLPRFNDDVNMMQKRFISQHGFVPPQGTVVWDLAATKQNDSITNARAINTLTNANVKINLQFAAAPSPEAYAVVGIELLQPVATQ